MMLNLPNLHDAVVLDCLFSGDRWVVNIQLYEISYPGKHRIRLTFSEICNTERVEKLHASITEYDAEPGFNGTRINAFHYDTKKTSKDRDLYLFLDADHADAVTIHCKKLTIEKHITYKS